MAGMKRFSETGRGMMAGGMCGFVLVTLLFALLTASNVSGLAGILFGIPIGMIVGAIVAKVRANYRLDINNTGGVQYLPVSQIQYSQLDITARFGDNDWLKSDEWIATTPLNLGFEDPNSRGLPSTGASDECVYELGAAMSLIRESIPWTDDGVYCPICHIANIDRSRLRTPCPKCGRELLSFGWD